MTEWMEGVTRPLADLISQLPLLGTEVAGNAVWRWLLAAAASAVVYGVLRLVLSQLTRRLRALTKRTETFADDYNLYMDCQQRLNLELCRRFEELGVEFAYPTRTLHVASGAGPARLATDDRTTLQPGREAAAEERSGGRRPPGPRRRPADEKGTT